MRRLKMSCLIWIYSVCKFSYSCVWCLTGYIPFSECLEPEDSLDNVGQTQTDDVIDADVINRSDNEQPVTQSNETEVEHAETTDDTTADTKDESKELDSKTELQDCNLEAKYVKEDEAAILAVTDTENVVSEPTPAGSDDEKVSQDSKTGSPSKTSDTDDDKEVETVKGTTKTFGVVPVEESEINIDSDAVETGPDPKVSRDDKGSPEKDDTLTSDKDNDKAGGDDDKDNELKEIEEKHLTPLIEIDPMHKVRFCNDLFTF